MEDFQHVGYSKEVIEFVAVAKEFCDFVETAPQMQRRDFIQRLQKFLTSSTCHPKIIFK